MKKIGKDKIIIFALAYLALNIILFAVFNNDKANVSDSNISTEESTNIKDSENGKDDTNDTSINTDNLDVTEITFTDEKILEAQEYMNLYDVIIIRKTTSTNTITTEPEYSAEFFAISDVCTEIDLSTMTDRTVITEDYSNEDATMLDFENEFGFNYKGYDNIFDISLAVAQTHGFNLNLENAVLDEDLKEVFGQNVYTLQDDSSVINKILIDLDYDELLETSCTYRMDSYINYFNARIKYIKDGQTVFYNLCLQIGLPESDAGCGCGCGGTDESTCGDDDCTTCNPVEANYE